MNVDINSQGYLNNNYNQYTIPAPNQQQINYIGQHNIIPHQIQIYPQIPNPNIQYIPINMLPQPQIISQNPAPEVQIKDALEELSNVNCAIVQQQLELLEIMSGCETCNKYRVSIPEGNGKKTLFKCKEVSSCLSRNCLSPQCHPFEMKIQQCIGTNMMSNQDYVNQFASFIKECQCTCLCINRPEIKLFYNDKDAFGGKVVEAFKCCSPKFHLYNKDGNIIYSICINCCQCGFYCRQNICGKLSQAYFRIVEGPDDNGKQVGLVTRKVSYNGLFSDADNFYIEFPVSANAEDKMLIICAVLMIDYHYYESNGNGQANRGGGGFYM